MHNHNKTTQQGWTFVEMLVAVAISAAALGAGALAIASISANAKRASSLITLNVGSSTHQKLYGPSRTTAELRTWMAPNYGSLIKAQEIRENMVEDARRASAVFCLQRRNIAAINDAVVPAMRPSQIPITAAEQMGLDNHNAFRDLIIKTNGSLGSEVFTAGYEHLPSLSGSEIGTSWSIYMLGMTTNELRIAVQYIYEIDYFAIGDGHFASVRKFNPNSSAVEQAYDVYYENETDPLKGQPMKPNLVAFESSARRATANASVQKFKVAVSNPFYLIWLPDPSINPLQKLRFLPTATTGAVREEYMHNGIRTSLPVVLPMFPSM